MLSHVGNLEIDLMKFLNNYDGTNYGVLLVMSKDKLEVNNNASNVSVESYSITDINKMVYEDLDDKMDDIHYRFITSNTVTILLIDNVTEQELNRNFNLKRIVEKVSLAIWENKIIKDRYDINTLYRVL